MASIRSTLVLLSVCVLTSACQKSENLDQLSRGEFSVAPDTITVRVAEYCPTNGRTYKDLFVRNFSTKVIHGELVLDSDADGLTDDVERQSAAPFNISPSLADTNMDFFSDFLVFTAGISIAQQDYLRCAEGGNIDDCCGGDGDCSGFGPGLQAVPADRAPCKPGGDTAALSRGAAARVFYRIRRALFWHALNAGSHSIGMTL